jgi:hypothetical protein
MGTKQSEGKRWYDRYPRLRTCLERFQTMGQRDRDGVIKGAMAIIKEKMPDVFDRFALDFPLDVLRRRWYDQDPYLWLLFNGLSVAEKEMIQLASEYLESAMLKKRSGKKR